MLLHSHWYIFQLGYYEETKFKYHILRQTHGPYITRVAYSNNTEVVSHSAVQSKC